MRRWVLFFPILISCSSDQPLIRPVSEQNQPALMHRSEVSPSSPNFPVFKDPVSAIVIGGAGLASGSDFYKKNSISGKCVISPEKDSLMDVPCREGTQVVLKDKNGKELTRSSLYNSEFAFKVKSDQTYKIEVESPGYMLAYPSPKPAVLGDQIILKLKKRK